MKKLSFFLGLSFLSLLVVLLGVAVINTELLKQKNDSDTPNNSTTQNSGTGSPDDNYLPTRNADENSLPLPIPWFDPDHLGIGGPPVWGYTQGWTIPETYIKDATRTIILPYEYHHAFAPYAIDISVINPSDDVIPVYSTLQAGTVIEINAPNQDGVEGAVYDPDSPYGNFLRQENARIACVNNEIIFNDDNPLHCDQNGDPVGNAKCCCEDLPEPWPATGKPTMEPDSCTCEYDTGRVDKDGNPIMAELKNQNTVRCDDLRCCVNGTTAADFAENRLPTLAAGQIPNYQTVIAHLTDGSIPDPWVPIECLWPHDPHSRRVFRGNNLHHDTQIGRIGNSGAEGGVTLTPMVHYEVWYNSLCDADSVSQGTWDPPDAAFEPINPSPFLNTGEEAYKKPTVPSPCTKAEFDLDAGNSTENLTQNMSFLDIPPGPDGKGVAGPAPTWKEIEIPSMECNMAYWEAFEGYGGMAAKLSDNQWFCDPSDPSMVKHEFNCATYPCDNKKAKDHLLYNPDKQTITDYVFSSEVMLSPGSEASDPAVGLYFRGTVNYDTEDGGNDAGGYYLTIRAGESTAKLLRIQKQGFCDLPEPGKTGACGECDDQCGNIEDFTNPGDPPLATFDTNLAGISQINLGEWYKLSVKVKGNTIECFLNEVGLGTITDDAYSEGTYGLKVYKALASFRNIQIEML